MFKLLFLSCVIGCIINCRGDEVSVIVSSEYVTPNSTYRVAVTPHDIDTVSQYIKIGIRNINRELESYDNHQYVIFEPNTTKLIEFYVGDIEYGDYQVYVEGQGQYNRRETHMVHCIAEEYIIEIAPLSPFQLRNVIVPIMVLIQKSDLRQMYVAENEIKFYLTNSLGFRREFDRNEVDFTSRPIITVLLNTYGLEDGEYTLETIYKHKIKRHVFEIVESDPNPFTVKLDAYVIRDTNNKRQLVVDVETSTKSGEIIEGYGELKIRTDASASVEIPKFYENVRITKPFNELNISEEYKSNIFVSADIEEIVNGYRMVSSKIFRTSSKQLEKYKIIPLNVCDHIRPGIRFFAQFIIKTRKGIPIVDKTNPITIRYSFNSEMADKFYKQIRMTSNDGVFDFHIDVPSNVESLTYKLEYYGAEYIETVLSVEKNVAYIQAHLIDKDTVEVRSTEYLTSLTYIVHGFKDKVLQAKTLPVPYRKITQFVLENTLEFPFQPTIEVFTYMPRFKKVISHSIHFPFENTCSVAFKGESEHLQRKSFDFLKTIDISVKCENGSSSVIMAILDENVFGGDMTNFYQTFDKDIQGTQELSAKYPYFQTRIIHTDGDRERIRGVLIAPTQWSTYSIYPIRNDMNAFELLKHRDEPLKVEIRDPRPLVFKLRAPEILYVGEVCDIPVDIYNRGPNDIETTIYFETTSDSKPIIVKANSRSTVVFPIQATKEGTLHLAGIAKTPIHYTKFTNVSFGESVDVLSHPFSEFSYHPIAAGKKTSLEITQAIKESSNQEISFGGFVVDWNVLYSPIAYVKDYLKIFASCVFALSYGKHPNHCHRYELKEWYRNIMSARDDDGHHRYKNTSLIVWPTVLTNRILRMADNQIDIDNKLLITSMDWIAKRFKYTSFVETERSEFPILRMTKCPKITQKAFVLLSYTESEEDIENYAEFIQSMKKYIEKELDSCDDMIAHVLANHVLYRLSENDDEKQEIIRRLKSTSKNENGYVWWEINDDGMYEDDELNAVNTEITSYALLTYLKEGSRSQTPAIIKWLGKQLVYRPSYVYMEAMIAAFKQIPYPTSYEQQKWKVFDGSHDYPKRGPIQLNFEHGVDPLIGTVRYVTEVEEIIRNHKINATLFMYNDQMRVCVSNEDENENYDDDNYESDSNLVVVEIYLPTDFSISHKELENLEESIGHEMVEMIEKLHMLKLYVKMAQHKCQSIRLTKRFDITRLRNSLPIIVYDYFNPLLKNVIFYDNYSPDNM